MLEIIGHFARWFEIFGSIVIIWGGIESIIYIIKGIVDQQKLDNYSLDKVICILGHKIVIGLDFFLAGDVLSTVITPTWDEIGKLGALVAIRTVVSHFILKEIRAQEKHAKHKK